MLVVLAYNSAPGVSLSESARMTFLGGSSYSTRPEPNVVLTESRPCCHSTRFSSLMLAPTDPLSDVDHCLIPESARARSS